MPAFGHELIFSCTFLTRSLLSLMKEVINTVLEDKIRIQAHSYKILFKKSYCSQAYG